ncbi:hypothetical protein DSO57_1031527 [Entomophthora muscae]|uniref:Uncharacterized protein n=1 Tax=Entomophthora muscae TaxID=34485 RepID=A0ACC2S2P5_9FUNG|nr:hypothetical protein DSO57_1031527 [Entomophthora muscae]
MNHLIFTAVLTACLGIRGYQPGPTTFELSPERLVKSYYKEPAQLKSLYDESWSLLVSLTPLYLLPLMRSAFWGSFKYGIEKEENCGRDLVGSNLGVSHVREEFEPLDTWTVM